MNTRAKRPPDATFPRTGTIHFNGTHAAIWEDFDDAHGDSYETRETRRREHLGGVEAAFHKLVGHLRARGFKVERDRQIHKTDGVVGRKGDLEFDAHFGGRHAEFNFWQNVVNVENQNGGRFDFDKLRRMPRATRLRCVAEITRLIRAMQALGYTYGPKSDLSGWCPKLSPRVLICTRVDPGALGQHLGPRLAAIAVQGQVAHVLDPIGRLAVVEPALVQHDEMVGIPAAIFTERMKLRVIGGHALGAIHALRNGLRQLLAAPVVDVPRRGLLPAQVLRQRFRMLAHIAEQGLGLLLNDVGDAHAAESANDTTSALRVCCRSSSDRGRFPSATTLALLPVLIRTPPAARVARKAPQATVAVA